MRVWHVLFILLILISCKNNKTNELIDAILLGDKNKAESLINNGVNLDKKGKQGLKPLKCAIISHQYEIAEMLLNGGADPIDKDDKGQTIIMYLAQKGKGFGRVLDLLLSKGANLNAQNVAGNTALHMAISLGNSESAFILIDKGANINISNKSDETAIDIAAQMCNYDIVKSIVAIMDKSDSTFKIFEQALRNADFAQCPDSLKKYLMPK